MATTSEIKTGMNEIASIISSQRAVVKKAVSNAAAASTELAAITTKYSDMIATVQAFTTANAFDAATKAEFAKLSAEYTSLKGIADGIAAVTV